VTTPLISIGMGFLESYSKIPLGLQRRVRQFFQKFRANPRSPGIRYKKLEGARDPNVRTVRIDQTYRAVVLHPEGGQVYALLWVDHHDEAIAWATRHRFEVHPETGTLQILDVQKVEALAPASSSPVPSGHQGLFQLPDQTLLELGVPWVLLPAIRALSSEAELDALEAHLPEEVHEALVGLRAGLSVEEVQEELRQRKELAQHSFPLASDLASPGDIQLAAALAHPDTRRRFAEVESDEDLARMLDGPLERWRIFLHPTQERLVTRKCKGSARVLGGAGTGKTVVALHRARHLARKVFPDPHQRILVTTFTSNLAQDLGERLDGLCGEEREKIEVTHLHSWAASFMRRQGISFQVATYGETRDAWENALAEEDGGGFDLAFLQGEWRDVIQAQGIRNEASYLRAPRRRRGTRLSRKNRRQVWKVCEIYRELLEEKNRKEWIEVIRETRRYLEEHSVSLPYQAILVDEVQDFHEEELLLLRALVPEGPSDLFLVGDSHQRIYGRPVTLSKLGINIRGRRSSRLRLNYRTTEEIRDFALGILSGCSVDDMDGGVVSSRGERSLLRGPQPEVIQCQGPAAEDRQVVATLRSWLEEDCLAEHLCLATRGIRQVKHFEALLQKEGLPTLILDRGRGAASSSEPGIRLATMHRVKGLEFHRVLLASIDEGVVPHPVEDQDPIARREAEQRERCLLYVAATRARDRLVLTSTGEPSSLLGAKSGMSSSRSSSSRSESSPHPSSPPR
jgi:superfamily I DNA/RNA helicase